MSRRRSTTRSSPDSNQEKDGSSRSRQQQQQEKVTKKDLDEEDMASHEDNEEEEQEEQEREEVFEFNGIQYETYQDMVQAKRARNEERLRATGLLDTMLSLKQQSNKIEASQRGLKRQRTTAVDKAPTTRRKSNRLQGIQSDGLFVQDESGGKFTVAVLESSGGDVKAVASSSSAGTKTGAEPQFYGKRLNDGSDMSLEEAVTQHVGEKWVTEDALTRAQSLCRQLSAVTDAAESGESCTALRRTSPRGTKKGGSRNSKTSPKSILETLEEGTPSHESPPSILEPSSALYESLAVDHPHQVAKVVPDRIYGMAVHPGTDQLVVCAGDKLGYVGLWKVQADHDGISSSSSSSDEVHLFKYHAGAAASLQWTSNGTSLFSTSYDGTCRMLDIATETVRNVFAVYDDEEEKYSNQAGYGLDKGYSYWTQFGCLDHRQEDCFFVSTSLGSVYHIDSRISGRRALTWQHELSEKKINTVSLHPNGHSLATSGLDCEVKLWDLRKFEDKRTPSPVATYHGGKSINSAFFSPSGNTVVATTMNHKLDLLDNFHLQAASKGSVMVKPLHSIRHDNLTGRWLTTFQAVWHPRYEIFGVGSMSKPRVVEVFGQAQRQCAVGGDALTAVASRLAFHPRTDRIILAGGNSSGRVTIVR